MPKDEVPNHNCIKHLRTVVGQQQTRISDLEKTVTEHKHQLGEQVSTPGNIYIYFTIYITLHSRFHDTKKLISNKI